jgi:hypothetical protein
MEWNGLDRIGPERKGRRGEERRGKERTGTAGADWTGLERIGKERQERTGMERRGEERIGSEWQEWTGWEWKGSDRIGLAGADGNGAERRGKDGIGVAGVDRTGLERIGKERQERRLSMKKFVVFVIFLSACGGRLAPADSPRSQCLDWANAAADLAERCYRGSWQDARDVFLEHTNGCDVRSLRDPEALYSECLPYLEAVSCSAMFLELPRGCSEQIDEY